uniref:Uncharacterized protein n=1 Tax=Chromera velia CCMP2878 TaxID=1169474 RepID=A0A0G4GQ46_9ALVE|eukprot:Cvel_701.t1-p1 / transcript=Cvel_701.t1 / gene=Cvel_701 / organism=Chromera_velia_CCMP2878 / gene_product=hypothetical protein / transcript_product=hypothetical protein / location=Cvel_scaffold22:1273-2481(-) / protein_length=403 / sequence_SO=supercontig / SO=protein_coding / is_pseudo=false
MSNCDSAVSPVSPEETSVSLPVVSFGNEESPPTATIHEVDFWMGDEYPWYWVRLAAASPPLSLFEALEDLEAFLDVSPEGAAGFYHAVMANARPVVGAFKREGESIQAALRQVEEMKEQVRDAQEVVQQKLDQEAEREREMERMKEEMEEKNVGLEFDLVEAQDLLEKERSEREEEKIRMQNEINDLQKQLEEYKMRDCQKYPPSPLGTEAVPKKTSPTHSHTQTFTTLTVEASTQTPPRLDQQPDSLIHILPTPTGNVTTNPEPVDTPAETAATPFGFFGSWTPNFEDLQLPSPTEWFTCWTRQRPKAHPGEPVHKNILPETQNFSTTSESKNVSAHSAEPTNVDAKLNVQRRSAKEGEEVDNCVRVNAAAQSESQPSDTTWGSAVTAWFRSLSTGLSAEAE